MFSLDDSFVEPFSLEEIVTDIFKVDFMPDVDVLFMATCFELLVAVFMIMYMGFLTGLFIGGIIKIESFCINESATKDVVTEVGLEPPGVIQEALWVEILDHAFLCDLY